MNELFDELEALIDKHGLATCLEVMANVAAIKGEHISSTWGYESNKNLIDAWTDAWVAIDRALEVVTV